MKKRQVSCGGQVQTGAVRTGVICTRCWTSGFSMQPYSIREWCDKEAALLPIPDLEAQDLLTLTFFAVQAPSATICAVGFVLHHPPQAINTGWSWTMLQASADCSRQLHNAETSLNIEGWFQTCQRRFHLLLVSNDVGAELVHSPPLHSCRQTVEPPSTGH